MQSCYVTPSPNALLSFLFAFQAVVCAVHVLRKAPDLVDTFIPLGEQLLNERNHGIFLLYLKHVYNTFSWWLVFLIFIFYKSSQSDVHELFHINVIYFKWLNRQKGK